MSDVRQVNDIDFNEHLISLSGSHLAVIAGFADLCETNVSNRLGNF